MLKKPEENIDLLDRLLAMILAPIFFTASTFIISGFVFRHTRISSGHIFVPPSISGVFLIYLAIPALAGFLLGTARCAQLLGHCFYTNAENEQDLRITIGIWLILFLVAYTL